jgi:hypothetical protein
LESQKDGAQTEQESGEAVEIRKANEKEAQRLKEAARKRQEEEERDYLATRKSDRETIEQWRDRRVREMWAEARTKSSQEDRQIKAPQPKKSVARLEKEMQEDLARWRQSPEYRERMNKRTNESG